MLSGLKASVNGKDVVLDLPMPKALADFPGKLVRTMLSDPVKTPSPDPTNNAKPKR
jgi:hypothetical protein